MAPPSIPTAMDDNRNAASSFSDVGQRRPYRLILPASAPSTQMELSQALDLATRAAVSQFQADPSVQGSQAPIPAFVNTTGYPVPTPSSQPPAASELTEYCGVYSPAIGNPHHSMSAEQLADPKLKYHCPRCDKRFTRRFTAKQHFPRCIKKYGNPRSLKWDDHASLRDCAHGRYIPRSKNAYNMRRAREHRQRSSLPDSSQYHVVSQLPHGTGQQPQPAAYGPDSGMYQAHQVYQPASMVTNDAEEGATEESSQYPDPTNHLMV